MKISTEQIENLTRKDAPIAIPHSLPSDQWREFGGGIIRLRCTKRKWDAVVFFDRRGAADNDRYTAGITVLGSYGTLDLAHEAAMTMLELRGCEKLATPDDIDSVRRQADGSPIDAR